jgi:hypothetical protein
VNLDEPLVVPADGTYDIAVLQPDAAKRPRSR